MCVCDGVCTCVSLLLLISQSIDYKYGVCLQHEMSGEVRVYTTYVLHVHMCMCTCT